MTIKDRYEKAGFKIEVKKDYAAELRVLWRIELSGEFFNRYNSEAEAWSWVEDNFPLPDIEAIKKKWQKRLKPIENNAITATPQQIKIYKRQQEIGYQKAVIEILSDLGEKTTKISEVGK